MYKPVCRSCFFTEQESKKRLEEVQAAVEEGKQTE
jgi:hypothetical protein